MTKTEGTGSGGGPGKIAEWARLHLWEIQPVRDVLLILALFGILWAGYTASIVTVPLLLALLLAYLFEPVVRRIARGNAVRRRMAAGGIVLGVILFVGVPVVLGAVWAITSGLSSAVEFQRDVLRLTRIVDQAEAPTQEQLDQDLPNRSWQEFALFLRDDAPVSTDPGADVPGPPAPNRAVDSVVTIKHVLRSAVFDLRAWALENQGILAKRAAATGKDAVWLLVRSTKTVVGLIFGAFLTAFFFFFVCSGYQRVLEFLRSLVPDKHRERVHYLASRMDRVVAGFVRGRLTICFVLSILFTIGYALIGVPLPMVMGVATGMFSIVPYLALITVPPVIILMFLDPSDGFRGTWWWCLFAPFGLYYAIQSMDDYVMTPRIQGKNTDMDMPSILFATFAGAALFGIYGMLIAIPLAACTKILWIEVALPRIEAWKKGRTADPLPIGGAPAVPKK